MNKINVYGVFSLSFLYASTASVFAYSSSRPCIYTNKKDRALIWEKIKNEKWATDIWNKTMDYVKPYMERNRKAPHWLVSRLVMYWKEGAHYTQCYLKGNVWEDSSKGNFPLLKNQQWNHETGNAPVPTVRFPGMQTWNQYNNVPLKDRIPYNETGNMLGYSTREPNKVIKVPYRETGYMIRENNNEILNIALQAAFIYYIADDKNYAEPAADVFYPWLMGTYYMNPILDPEQCTGSPGGYAPGGVCGFYDYESIHDDLQTKTAPMYDFLYNHLEKQPYKPLTDTGKSLKEVCEEGVKKFLDISMVRLGNTDNWNINAWDMMIPSMLVLETDSFYIDDKEREYYLNFFTKRTTTYHEAIPDMMKRYDPVIGLSPEPPSYAFGTVNAVISLALPVYKAGYDILNSNPMIKKAAFAVFPWTDTRGDMIVFGNSHGRPVNYKCFEQLLAYYTRKNDSSKIELMKFIIRKGIDTRTYRREDTNWKGLVFNVSGCESSSTYSNLIRMPYSPAHLMVIMKNGNDVDTRLMTLLYGGGPRGKHLSANGLAMQLYSSGGALAPDASGYESYWSPDYIYQQTVTGANTIAPGYVRGPIKINAMEPYVSDTCYVSPALISDYCQFADISAAEKRRLLGIIRTSDLSGYYVNIFRSDLEDNDYIYHNLGDTLIVRRNGEPLLLQTADCIEYPDRNNNFKADNSRQNYDDGYKYFKNLKNVNWNSDFIAEWTIQQEGGMAMNMTDEEGRTIYIADTPKPRHQTKLRRDTKAPTIIARQENRNRWKYPFISVFKPYKGKNNSIRHIDVLHRDSSFITLLVESCIQTEKTFSCKNIIFNSIDEYEHTIGTEITFKGIYEVISENLAGVHYLYLGKGSAIQKGNISLVSKYPISTCFVNKEWVWYYSSDGEAVTTIEGSTTKVMPGYDKVLF